MELYLGIFYMTNIVEEIISAVSEVNPDSPAILAAKAALETLSNPTPAKLIEDLALACELIKRFREEMNGLDPTVVNILRTIF